MPMMVAVETLWDADNNRIGRAAVTATYELAVVCQRIGHREWEPLYVISTRAQERQELPPCFELSGEALLALNFLAEHEHD
jgi:hypothetical protein